MPSALTYQHHCTGPCAQDKVTFDVVTVTSATCLGSVSHRRAMPCSEKVSASKFNPSLSVRGSPRRLTISPRLLEAIVEELLHDGSWFDEETGALFIFNRQRWSDLLNLALVGRQWVGVSRKIMIRCLLRENPPTGYPQPAGLIPLFMGPVQSTFSGVATFFGLDLTQSIDVQSIMHGFFWRAPRPLLEGQLHRFERQCNPFLQLMATVTMGQKMLGEALFNGTTELEIRAPQYPYYLFPKEIEIISTSFRNITNLTMITSWCCHTFTEAVRFIASFPKLTHFACGDLLLREDNEASAWHSLAEVATEARLPNLVSAALVGELSPYTPILFMLLGCYPRLEALKLHLAGLYIIRIWDEYRERVAQLLREVNRLTVSVIEKEQPGPALRQLDLTSCRHLEHFTLHTRTFVPLRIVLEECVPRRHLKTLTIHGLHSPDQLRELEKALSTYNALRAVHFKLIVPPNGIEDAKLERMQRQYLANLPDLISRGISITVSISTAHNNTLR